jgi:hypothetical protein
LGNAERIDAGRLPPGLFVAEAVDLPVMYPAERYREFIARLAAERARLRISASMRPSLTHVLFLNVHVNM